MMSIALHCYGRRETMLGAEETVLEELILAVTACGKKPFVQIKPSADLDEIAIVNSWDTLASQGK